MRRWSPDITANFLLRRSRDLELAFLCHLPRRGFGSTVRGVEVIPKMHAKQAVRDLLDRLPRTAPWMRSSTTCTCFRPSRLASRTQTLAGCSSRRSGRRPAPQMATRRRPVVWSLSAQRGLEDVLAYIAGSSLDGARLVARRALEAADSFASLKANAAGWCPKFRTLHSRDLRLLLQADVSRQRHADHNRGLHSRRARLRTLASQGAIGAYRVRPANISSNWSADETALFLASVSSAASCFRR